MGVHDRCGGDGAVALDRDRIYEIEDIGMELERDQEEYASYELVADDELFLEEAKTPLRFVGESMIEAIYAACVSHHDARRYTGGQPESPRGGRMRAARSTAVRTPGLGTPRNGARPRRLRIATHCPSVAQFVDRFHPFCGERSIFVAHARGEVGTHTMFSFDLEDGTTAFCGLGVVADQFATHANRFGRPGILISIRRLQADSQRVFCDLLAARRRAQQTPSKPVPARRPQSMIPRPSHTPTAAAHAPGDRIKAAVITGPRTRTVTGMFRVVPPNGPLLAARPARIPSSTLTPNLEEQVAETERWRALADFRGELAKRAANPTCKARLLRAQAHALRYAGDAAAAAAALASAARCMNDV